MYTMPSFRRQVAAPPDGVYFFAATPQRQMPANMMGRGCRPPLLLLADAADTLLFADVAMSLSPMISHASRRQAYVFSRRYFVEISP